MKLEFTLRQHTPMIHFQHDQVGATLRATELKPKLDKYIIEHEFGSDFDKCKQLLVGYSEDAPNALRSKFEKDGFRALDYKVSIVETSIRPPTIINQVEEIERLKLKPDRRPDLNRKGEPERFPYPCFFGNMGEKERKWFTIYDTLRVRFTFFIAEVESMITKGICPFFSVTNFGTRQSKGFGSFYLHENDPYFKGISSRWHFSVDVSNPEIDKFKPRGAAEAYFPYENDKEYYKLKTLFRKLSLVYSTLRSGYNFGGLYFKSLMFMYAKQLNPPQQWDKRTLREHFYSSHPTYIDIKSKRTDQDGTVLYDQGRRDNLLFRDLMGLSSQQDWMNYGKERTSKNGRTMYGSDTLAKKEAREEIQRYRSPITFKPIRREGVDIFDVHIFASPIPKEYLGREFIVTSETTDNPLTLRTPSQFNMNGYLEFCFKNCFKDRKSFERHLSNNMTNKDAQFLASVYDELRRQ